MKFRCAHISDVHWRGLTRHEEYRESFQHLFDKLKELKPNAIFIGGDIVHSKTQGISPELIDCLNWWFTSMAEICDTHIILGNHDGLVLNKDRQDAITPIVSALNNPRLHLYKNSGVYPIAGVPGFNWCVFSCFDEEGWENVVPVPGEVNIATLHGSVLGSKTDVDWELEGEVNTDHFKDFDFGFLGDIHMMQYLDPERRIAYPGSTIQQNYGESPEKGFLFWEIEDSDNYSSEFIQIPNRRPFVTVDWTGDMESMLRECSKHVNGTRFRVRTDIPISNAETKQLFGELKQRKKATEVVFKYDIEHDTSEINFTSGSFRTEDLRTLSTHHRLMRDYFSNSNFSSEQWKSLEDLTHKYFAAASKSDCVRNIKWSVKKLEFDNTFGYGKNNHINFENLRGITGLFGKNRSGKSSIPGTVMYGLFNTTDRGAVKNLHVINVRKGHCQVNVTMSANGHLYRSERQSVRRTTRKGKVHAVTSLNLFRVNDEGSIIKDMNGEQRRDTEKVLRGIVGTAEDFLLTSLASQGEMSQFIKYRATQRKSILTKFLDLEIFDEMHYLAKSDSSDIKSMLSNVPDRDWDAIIVSMNNQLKEKRGKKDQLEKDIRQIRDRLQQTQIAMATVDSASLVTEEDLKEKAEELNQRKDDLDKMLSDRVDLKEEISQMLEKLSTIQELKEQFPIVNLRERFEEHQDLERNLLETKHRHEKEKDRLKSQKKSLKLLEEVPCNGDYPNCKFIKNSHENMKKMPGQEKVVEEISEEIASLKKSLKSLSRENLREKIDKYNKVLQRERDLELEVSNKRLILSKSNGRIKTLQSLVNGLEKEYASMSIHVSNSEEAERARRSRQLITKLNNEINNKDAERLSLAESVGQISSRVQELVSEREKYSKLISKWRTYELFLNAVSKKGIPLQIMSSQLPLINTEISRILQGVTGFTVELEATPGTNDMDIYINYGDSRRIIEVSSGMEKMMASLAIRVALINITSLPKSDMLIIDEGFGALDDTNLEACNRLLASLKKWFRNILVISHVDAVKDSVDNVLDITQKEKNSHVRFE